MRKIEYPFIVRSLSKSEGDGYLIEFPDLPGCMSDGETVEEAIEHGQDAMKCWISAAKRAGREIPKPTEKMGGKWVQRVPKSLHSRLVTRAKSEGVSLNTLVISMISESLGRKNSVSSRHQHHN